MSQPIVSKKRAKAFSSALFVVGLAILGIMGSWWPGMMLVIGIPLALRQLLLKKPYDVIITLAIFIGGFISGQFSTSWDITLPIMFVLGGIYIFFRDYIESSTSSEVERDENLNEEIEEEQHPR